MKINSKKYQFINCTIIFILTGILFSCKNSSNQDEVKETIIRGNATIVVDETLRPIMEDQIAVFENQYPAKIKQINLNENEVVRMLTTQEQSIALMGRELTKEESAVFRNKKIKPRTTLIAVDAIALITSSTSRDTLVNLEEINKVMQGKESTIAGLVFENANSSPLSYLNQLAGVSETPKRNIYSLKNVAEVFNYVIANPNKIGVIGLNILVQPTPDIADKMKKIKVLSVRNVKTAPNSAAYYKPSQDNLGADLYPLSRKVYMLNYQGSSGLGMGFASFVAGEIGQRIILKSGLLPTTIPSRSVQIRKNIINNQ